MVFLRLGDVQITAAREFLLIEAETKWSGNSWATRASK